MESKTMQDNKAFKLIRNFGYGVTLAGDLFALGVLLVGFVLSILLPVQMIDDVQSYSFVGYLLAGQGFGMMSMMLLFCIGWHLRSLWRDWGTKVIHVFQKRTMPDAG